MDWVFWLIVNAYEPDEHETMFNDDVPPCAYLLNYGVHVEELEWDEEVILEHND